MFFQMGKMCVAYSKRLILVFCVLLSVASVYASSDKYAYAEAKIHPSSPALGKVYADGTVSDANTETKDAAARGISKKSSTGSTNVSITLSADAINNTHKSYFEGWTDDATSLTIKDTNTQKTFFSYLYIPLIYYLTRTASVVCGIAALLC